MDREYDGLRCRGGNVIEGEGKEVSEYGRGEDASG